mmetsp:Transcript_23169/g.33251  ORF Transcript_23169/g.33251 Transcript_23169/m.33251 type:complete len:89 (+) Transcript_23169:337-603(+)
MTTLSYLCQRNAYRINLFQARTIGVGQEQGFDLQGPDEGVLTSSHKLVDYYAYVSKLVSMSTFSFPQQVYRPVELKAFSFLTVPYYLR